jgi:hypothetical protein
MLGQVEVNNSLHTQFARAQAFLPPQLLGFLAILKFFFEEYLNWFCRPVEVMCRKNFGVRGHGLFQTLQICVIGSLFGLAVVRYDPLMTLFCLASAALAVYHRFEAVRSEMRNVARYSWSSGEPIQAWGWVVRTVQQYCFDPRRFVTVPYICRFYEPGLVLVIGLIIRPISPILGTYLAFCSVALFLKALIVHNRLLNMKRDQIDGRIMNEWIASIHRTAGGRGEQKCFVVRLAEPPLSKPAGVDVSEQPASPEEQPGSSTAVVADNLVSVNCRKCKAQFNVDRKYRGRKGTCKKCGAGIVVGAV